MFSKPFVVAALAAGCVAAAAAGAYVSLQGNRDAQVASAPAAPAAEPQQAKAVAETEAVVTPAAAAEPQTHPTTEASAPPVSSRSAAPEERRRDEPVTNSPAAARTQSRSTVERAHAERTVPSSGRTTATRPNPAERDASARADATPAAPAAPSSPVARTPIQEPSSPAPASVNVETTSRPEPLLEQLVIPSSSVIGLRVETPLSTERTRVEDRVDARVTRDVLADGRVAVPAGTRAVGSVVLVEPGGKMRDRARLGVRFHTLILDDGTELPVTTEAIYREGESPSTESTRKIGGAAIGGAILGAIIGGKKGAIVGSATGAAGGAAVVMAGDRNAATLPAGSIVTIRLAAPVEVEVEKR